MSLFIDRAGHRTSLQDHTSGKLTDSTAQDKYIDRAEPEVITDWVQFHEGLQARIKTSIATDANGILLMTQGFSKLFRMEDSSKIKYPFIDTMDDRNSKTGYFFVGFDATNKKQQIQVMKQGSVRASATMSVWDVTIILMGSGTTASSAIPPGFQEMLGYWAAKKYWQDQGPSMKKEANYWEDEYNKLLVKGRELYGSPTKDFEFVESFDPDAGEFGIDIGITRT